jgi:hypothetical protein
MMFDPILEVMNGFSAKIRFNRPAGTGLFFSLFQALRACICLASYGPKWPRKHSPGLPWGISTHPN